MSNLEANHKMSVQQFSIVLAEVMIGTEMITLTGNFITGAEQASWLSILLGSLLFYVVAWSMLKLGEQFPDTTLVEYMPQIWGHWGGTLVIWWFNSIFLLLLSSTLASFSQTIAFFFFDRTPTEVIVLGMLLACVYAALQDFGTLLRLMELIFFTVIPLFFLILLLALLNFKPENLLPLWPENPTKIITTCLTTWPIYAGYELILLLFPLIYRSSKLRITRLTGVVFGSLGLLFAAIQIITIGDLTVEGAKSYVYPSLEIVREIQIPGTFIERLEGYFLLLWIPIAFDGLMTILWGVSQVLRQRYGYTDHRVFVLILTPIIFTGSVLFDNSKMIETANLLVLWLGLGFSLGLIPLSLLLAWRQKRGDNDCKNGTANG